MSSTILKTWLTAVCSLLVISGAASGDSPISGKFELTDHNGQDVTEKSYDGKLRLVFFGFTRCPDVCPTTLFEIRNALEQIGDDADQVRVLFVSVDREYDSKDQLANYAGAFHPSVIGLTGSDEQLAAAAEAFNVTYGIQSAEDSVSGNEEIFHTAYVFLMDRRGGFIDVMGYGTRASRIAETLERYL